ncbi:MAG: DUF3850 domain-containing protein [Pseudomonadota bacterium]
MKHTLKILPQYFSQILSGAKTFEYRYNDRNYAVGDTLELKELSAAFSAPVGDKLPDSQPYTGRSLCVHVTSILEPSSVSGGCEPGWVIMSIRVPPVPLP